MRDNLYLVIKSYVKEQDKISTSHLQRKFKIGYNRAATIMELLEQERVVNPVRDKFGFRKVLQRTLVWCL